jgi:hypothetical protein
MAVARAKRGMPDDWRSVPMPRGVARLPRTNGGIPITYTVAWSSETGPEAREDPLLRGFVPAGTLALFHSGAQGQGTPKLAVSDVARTRRVVMAGLCQACGQKLPGRSASPWRQHPRWLCDLRNQGQEIQIGLRRVPLIVDGWTCEPCLAYALRVCPGLVTKAAATGGDGLRLLRVRDAEGVATIEAVEGLDDHVVGWVKIAPTSFEIFTPDEFLALIG